MRLRFDDTQIEQAEWEELRGKALHNTQSERAKWFAKREAVRRKEPRLNVGTQVLLYERTRKLLTKLEEPWSGPYLVLRCLDSRHYEIRKMGRIVRVHGDDLMRFFTQESESVAQGSV